MSAPEFNKLPARVRRVIERCRGGQMLCKTLRHKETGNCEVLFSFYPSEKPAPLKSSEAAIASGFLIAQQDGLFDGDSSQTWRAA